MQGLVTEEGKMYYVPLLKRYARRNDDISAEELELGQVTEHCITCV